MDVLPTTCSRHTMTRFTNAGCSVPLDVVELIMQHLASVSSFRSLQRCALVCKDFAPICQKQIFTDIALSNRAILDGTLETCPALVSFKKALDSKPYLEGYVCALDYHHCLDWHNRWPPVFQHLRHVRSLRMRLSSEVYIPSWSLSRVHSAFKSSFLSFIQSNQITQLELSGIYDLPTSIFGLLPCLEDLRILHFTLNDDPPFVQKCPPKLRCLRVQHEQPVNILIAARHSIVDLRALRHFEVHMGYTLATMSVIRRLLQQSEVLESLSFDGSSPFLDFRDTLARYLPQKSLGSLRHIELFIDLSNIEDDPYLNLASELDKLSGNNVLETLIFTIMVPIRSTCTTDTSRWSELDRVLSQSRAFPRLRRVQVSLDVSYMYEEDRDKEVERKLAVICDEAFPWLKGNREVEFDISLEVSPID